ncbi:methyltransferase domain-containing protein [Streptomyces sp. NPDC057638]|uniref:methyltransferase domain-containing protein n=1 Tax=Streptomyces sp. NPDC057638 TaxID=3346190 RepID=UPI0036A1105F
MNDSSCRPGRRALLRQLRDSGVLAADWVPAFEAVDRAAFLPDLLWPYDMESRTSQSVDRAVDPAAWYACADADRPVTVQWDDGDHHGKAPGRVPTSSVSMPSVVASMLAELDVRPGCRVLEIGTGAGWNAALLAHRLGGEQVVTVEVDAEVAATARTRLRERGLRPEVVTGDGLLGHAARAPYDRIIATAGLRRIPFSWVEQTVPGGLIVAPWGTAFANTDHVVRLTVRGDGRAASGRLSAPVEFMKVRSQRHEIDPGAYLPGGFPGAATVSPTTLSTRDLGGGQVPRHPFLTAAGLLIPDCVLRADRRGTRVSTWLYDLGDLSWAAAVLTDGVADSTVYQSGPRRLWDELTSAHRWWTGNGCPAPDRFGLTVTPTGNTAWLDAPDRGL